MAKSIIEEKYRFASLEQMYKAVIEAFGSHDNSSCSFRRGLVLEFTPTESRMFNTKVRTIISEYGGQLI